MVCGRGTAVGFDSPRLSYVRYPYMSIVTVFVSYRTLVSRGWARGIKAFPSQGGRQRISLPPVEGFRRNMKTVTIYTDGACSGNPGPGGWGAILMYGPHKKELSGGEARTTNNRMELTGVITALEALKEPCTVELYSDSKYVIDALEKGWAKGWRAKGWIKSDKKPALNPDLWERLLELCDYHTVNLHWVKGHASNPYNNRCDELAVAESRRYKEES